ncbi:MAG: ATP-dependent 6-phosphofructokinase [Deltaproteobacteria bacterium]|nr:ATP-dependent 6-phosphofructokinase [Deltaproteobacteria bacterium]
MSTKIKGTIAILTGGGDVPGLNPAIRAATIRANRNGYRVVGLRNGWEGIMKIDRTKPLEEQEYCQILTEKNVQKIARTGGTFLHTSRTKPSKVSKDKVPENMRDKYNAEENDLTDEIIKNLEYLGIEYLVPIGGDDTLSYGLRLHKAGVRCVGIPKTMDNDVPGTDYCIGFSTCVTRTIEFTHQLRTCAGSHERILVIEVMGRYAGYTALVPAMAGASDRCVIPEFEFDIERLTELLVKDRRDNESNYSVVLISEGAMFKGADMIFSNQETDAYGHKKLGGIGDMVSAEIAARAPKYNNGETIHTINQRMSYMTRSGQPDAIDSIVPMAYGNLAMDLIMEGKSGRMVCLKNGRYDHVPFEVVTEYEKKIDVERFYDTERYRPHYHNCMGMPQFIMTSD